MTLVTTVILWYGFPPANKPSELNLVFTFVTDAHLAQLSRAHDHASRAATQEHWLAYHEGQSYPWCEQLFATLGGRTYLNPPCALQSLRACSIVQLAM